jgi:hypothetical protein
MKNLTAYQRAEAEAKAWFIRNANKNYRQEASYSKPNEWHLGFWHGVAHTNTLQLQRLLGITNRRAITAAPHTYKR